MKNKKDLKDYSKDAFLHIPPASANDHTGYTPYLPDEIQAENIGDMMDVPATGKRYTDKKEL